MSTSQLNISRQNTGVQTKVDYDLQCVRSSRMISRLRCQRNFDWLPSGKNTIICGDSNAHSALWDTHQPADTTTRGELLLD